MRLAHTSRSLCASLLRLAVATALALSMMACVDRARFKPSPETARRELALRGLEFNEREFILTVRDGKPGLVKLFLIAGMDPNARDERGEAALCIAVREGSVEVARALIKGGSDVNGPNCKGVTPLMLAARDGKRKMVEALLDGGAAVNAHAPVNGATALMYASWSGDDELLKFLLERARRSMRAMEMG